MEVNIEPLKKDPNWGVLKGKQNEFMKAVGLTKWDEFMAKYDEIIGFLLENPDLDDNFPRQIVYFQEKYKDDNYLCSVFYYKSKVCGNAYPMVISDIKTYHLDDILDMYNNIQSHAYFTEYGIICYLFED